MRNSFPNKSEAEINHLVRGYYKYLCDLIVEIIKTRWMSEDELKKRCQINPKSLARFKELYEQKQSLIVLMGHHGNWEWSGASFCLNSAYPLNVVYKPIKNKGFDKMMLKIRSRFGSIPIPMNNVFRVLAGKKDKIEATAFIADQSPSPENAYWTSFLNQETPFYTGMEKIAIKLNYPVVFVAIRRIRRGYYEVELKELFINPSETIEGEITEAYIQTLEKEILNQPETWLWSHRRWKHKKPLLPSS